MRRVSIHGDRTAGYETQIDGVDVSPFLNGMRLTLGSGEQPELIISTGSGRLDIDVDATVVLEDPTVEHAAIRRFLDGIDATALEEAMLDGDMTTSVAQMALSTLKRIADESYGQGG